MTLAFKVEQSKIPEFYGQKGKDNITAIVFIGKINDFAQTNRWNDTTTYVNVANTLKGFTYDWLFTMAEMLVHCRSTRFVERFFFFFSLIFTFRVFFLFFFFSIHCTV